MRYLRRLHQLFGSDPAAISGVASVELAIIAPILAVAREQAGGAIDPITTYRASGYRQRKAQERPTQQGAAASGIV